MNTGSILALDIPSNATSGAEITGEKELILIAINNFSIRFSYLLVENRTQKTLDWKTQTWKSINGVL